MLKHVTPWWFDYLLDNPLRRVLHRPERLLAPYVREGMSVLDIGCGMGFFSIPMARMVGASGCVVALDIHERVLEVLRRRALRAGVAERIRAHVTRPDDLGLTDEFDFALAFWVVHEHPNPALLLRQIRAWLKPGARLLLVEPRLDVAGREFREVVELAEAAGLRLTARPQLSLSLAALLQAPGE